MTKFTSSFFCFGSVGITVGSTGTIVRTVDSGVTWSSIESGTILDLNCVDVTRNTLVCICICEFMQCEIYFIFCLPQVGYIAGNVGLLLRTSDAGLTWSMIVWLFVFRI